MLISTKEIFRACYRDFGIAAVNVINMEQVMGLFRAGVKAGAPFIVQTTPVARNYAHSKMLLNMINAAAVIYPDAVYAVHLDHGYEEHILDALSSGGYTSVMIDASHDSFEENVRRTRAMVERAHAFGVSVEAELGVLSGVEDDLSVDDKNALYTRPEEVEEFVVRTNCDSLAVAVGTSHGAYKFSGGSGLQFDILREIQDRLPGFPLVLHGGSAVDPEEIERINISGGKLNSNARGVGDDQIRKAIEYGVCKINIATDLRILWARVHREFFRNSPELFDPIIPGKTYVEAIERFMLKKFEMLNATDKAALIKTSV